MPKIPQILGPSVQQGAAPRPYDTTDVGSVGRGMGAVAGGIDAVGRALNEFHQAEKQRAQEEEYTDKRTRFQSSINQLSQGDGTEENPGYESMLEANAKGVTDGTPDYPGVLPTFDEYVSYYTDLIADRDVRERFLQAAAADRVTVEFQARRHERTEGRKRQMSSLEAGERAATESLVALTADPSGLQQNKMNRVVEDLKEGWAATGKPQDWINDRIDGFVSGARIESISTLLTAKNVGAARVYYDAYGHEIQPTDRDDVLAELERREGVQAVAEESLEIFDKMKVDGALDEGQKILLRREYQRVLTEHGAAIATSVLGQVNAMVSMDTGAEIEANQQTFLDGTRWLYGPGKGSLGGYDYTTLDEPDQLRLESMERDLRAANMDANRKEGTSIARLDVLTDPDWQTDPLGVLAANAHRLSKAHFDALGTKAAAIDAANRAGTAAQSARSDHKWLLDTLRGVFKVGKSKNDEWIKRQYLPMFDALDEAISEVPADRPGHGLSEEERETFKQRAAVMGTTGDYVLFGSRGGGTKPVLGMTGEELEDVKLTRDSAEAAFPGQINYVDEAGVERTATAYQAALWTAEVFVKNRTKGTGGVLDSLTDDDWESAVVSAVMGSNPELMTLLQFHKDAGTFLTPDRIGGDSGLPEHMADIQGGSGRAGMVITANNVAAGRGAVVVAKRGGIPEEHLAAVDEAAVGAGYVAAEPGVRESLYLLHLIKKEIAAGAVDKFQALTRLGMDPDDAIEYAAMSLDEIIETFSEERRAFTESMLLRARKAGESEREAREGRLRSREGDHAPAPGRR